MIGEHPFHFPLPEANQERPKSDEQNLSYKEDTED